MNLQLFTRVTKQNNPYKRKKPENTYYYKASLIDKLHIVLEWISPSLAAKWNSPNRFGIHFTCEYRYYINPINISKIILFANVDEIPLLLE